MSSAIIARKANESKEERAAFYRAKAAVAANDISKADVSQARTASVSAEPVISSTPAKKFCTHCGTSLTSGNRFCGECGTCIVVSGDQTPALVPKPDTTFASTPVLVAAPAARDSPEGIERKVLETKEDRAAYYRAKAAAAATTGSGKNESDTSSAFPETVLSEPTIERKVLETKEDRAAYYRAKAATTAAAPAVGSGTDTSSKAEVSEPKKVEHAARDRKRSIDQMSHPPTSQSREKYVCSICAKSSYKNLSSDLFSVKALQNFRGKQKKPLKCKQCVADGVVAEQKAAAERIAATVGDDEVALECSSCNKELPSVAYNKTQLNKKEKRRCRACLQASEEDEARIIQANRANKVLKLKEKSAETVKKAPILRARTTDGKGKMRLASSSSSSSAPSERHDGRTTIHGVKSVSSIDEMSAPCAQNESVTNITPKAERKVLETKEDRAAYYRAKAAAAATTGSGKNESDTSSAFPETVLSEPTIERKVLETKEDRAAYYRAKAATTAAAPAVGSGTDTSSKAEVSEPKKVEHAARDRKRSIDQMSHPPTSRNTGGHDGSKYLKKFTTDSGKSNGQNTKISFD